MSGRSKRIAVIGAIAVGVVGIAGTAMGAGSSPSSSFLNDFARRLGVSPSKVQSAYKGAMSDRLNALVKQGKLTKQQAQQLEQHMQDHSFNGPGFFGPGMGGAPRHPGFWGHGSPHPMGGGLMMWTKAAAGYLGITQAELGKELRAGKTPAQIATAHGKTAAGLEQVLVAAAKKPLDDAVKSGKMTQAQATRIEKFLSDSIDRLVTNGFQFHHFGWGGQHGSQNAPKSQGNGSSKQSSTPSTQPTAFGV